METSVEAARTSLCRRPRHNRIFVRMNERTLYQFCWSLNAPTPRSIQPRWTERLFSPSSHVAGNMISESSLTHFIWLDICVKLCHEVWTKFADVPSRRSQDIMFSRGDVRTTREHTSDYKSTKKNHLPHTVETLGHIFRVSIHTTTDGPRRSIVPSVPPVDDEELPCSECSRQDFVSFQHAASIQIKNMQYK